MTKKTRLIPFDYQKYLDGAKAVCRDSKYKLRGIYLKENSTFPYFLIYELPNGYCEHELLYRTGKAGANQDKEIDVFLVEEVEERTFYVNVYKNGDVDAYKYEDIANNTRGEHHIGLLKVTYTDEDLIK